MDTPDARGPNPETLERIAVFSFDQENDVIYRLLDLNGDGDCNDSDEVSRFFDDSNPVTGIVNSQGLYAVNANTLLATDNYPANVSSPAPNVVRLYDDNLDGDALDDGESVVLWDGALSGDLHLDNPTSIAKMASGNYAVMDNNHLAFQRYTDDGGYPIPFAIYELDDADNNGSISVAEHSVYHELSAPGASDSELVAFDMAFDDAGNGYFLNVPSDSPPHFPEQPSWIYRDRLVERIDSSGVRTPFLAEEALESFQQAHWQNSIWSNRMDVTADGWLVVSAHQDDDAALFAARDQNASGDIDDASEIRVIWKATGAGVGADFSLLRDFKVLENGTVIVSAMGSENVRLVRLDDENGDGDYLDNETTIIYSVSDSTSSEELSSSQLSVSAALVDGAID